MVKVALAWGLVLVCSAAFVTSCKGDDDDDDPAVGVGGESGAADGPGGTAGSDRDSRGGAAGQGRDSEPLGDAGTAGSGRAPSIIQTEPAEPSACPAGGIVIRVGTDSDGNGVLSSEEVQSTDLLCNGTDGDSGGEGDPGAVGTSCSVVENGDGTATIACDDGTSAVVGTGLEGDPGEDGSSCSVVDNGDGTATIECDDGTSAVVGTGEPTDPGELLIETAVEPPGSNCGLGGDAIHVGYDRDDSGSLSEDEITSTTYLCTEAVTCEKDVVVEDDSVARDALGDCPVLFGDLTFDCPQCLAPPELGVLQAVSGSVHIIDTGALQDVSGLDNLTYVGGSLMLYDTNLLTSLNGLGSLTTVEGLVMIRGDALTSLTGLDNLTLVGGPLGVLGAGSLADITALRSLSSVAGLSLSAVTSLQSLDGLQGLTTVPGDVMVGGSAWLPDLTGFDNLVSIGGNLQIGGNDALVSLVGLERLSTVGGNLAITNNDQLPQCVVDEAVAAIATVGGTVTTTPNGSTDPALCEE